MNVKKSFTLSERSLQLAEKLVEDGQFPSVEKVLEAGIDRLMWSSEPVGDDDPVAAMGDEIRRRMELPRDQWLPGMEIRWLSASKLGLMKNTATDDALHDHQAPAYRRRSA
jgi:antitoxin ParD1/3/4